MSVQVGLDTVDKQKLAEALKGLDVDKLMRVLIEMLSVLGNLSVSLGKIEQESKETFEFIRIVNADPKSFLSKILEKASAEEVKTLMEVLLRLDSIGPKFSKILDLSPEEKISVGNELIDISKQLKRVFKKSVR